MLILSRNLRIAITFAVTLAALAASQLHDEHVRGLAEIVLALGAAVGIFPAHLDLEVEGDE